MLKKKLLFSIYINVFCSFDTHLIMMNLISSLLCRVIENQCKTLS